MRGQWGIEPVQWTVFHHIVLSAASSFSGKNKEAATARGSIRSALIRFIRVLLRRRQVVECQRQHHQHKHAQKEQRDKESGQHGLFGVFQQEQTHVPEVKLPDTPDWDEHTRLANEKEILGFFITGHPLEKIEKDTDRDRFMSAEEALEYGLIDQVIEHMEAPKTE